MLWANNRIRPSRPSNAAGQEISVNENASKFITSAAPHADIEERRSHRPTMGRQTTAGKRRSTLWGGLWGGVMGSSSRSNAAEAEEDKAFRFDLMRKWSFAIRHAQKSEARYIVVGRLADLSKRKKRMLYCAVVLCTLSLIALVVHMELRLTDTLALLAEEEARYDYHCDVLRTVECALTACLVLAIAQYYVLHHHLLYLINSSRVHRSGPTFALLELLPLLVGVLPPGINGTMSLHITQLATDYGIDEVVRHVDCYCLLQFLRAPLLAKWVTVLLLTHVKSPAVLGWEHSMAVEDTFRLKYAIPPH